MATVIDEERLRGKEAASPRAGGAGGGNMDDILRRVSVVESSVAVIRADVSAIKAVLPHLARQSRLSEVEGSLNVKVSTLEGSLTARINTVEGSLTARINTVEGSLTARINSVEGALTARINAVEGALIARINSVEGSLTAKINSVEGALTTKISDLEASLIRWVVGTGIAVGSLAFAVAKFVN